MRILAVDFETSGIDPLFHAPLAIGWVLLDDKLEEISHGESLIKPFEGAVVDPTALAINNLTMEMCGLHGRTEEEVLDILDTQIRNTTTINPETNEFVEMEDERVLWAGHNPHFDWTFYQAMLNRAGRMVPSGIDYHMLDVWSLGMLHLYNGSVGETRDNTSLKDLMKTQGMSSTAHQALADAMAVVEIIRSTFHNDWRIGKSDSLDPTRI